MQQPPVRAHLLVTFLGAAGLLLSAACSGDDSFKTEMTARLSRLEAERDQASKEADSLRQELRRLRAEAPAGAVPGAPAAAPAAPAAPGAAPAQPARPAPAAVPTGQVRYIAGTDGVGVRVRGDCKDDAAGTGGLGEGTRVTVEAGRQDCSGWLQVRGPDGTSWVREQYLSANTPTPTRTPLPVTPTNTPTPEPPTATPAPALPIATPTPVATPTPALGGNTLAVVSYSPGRDHKFGPPGGGVKAFQATVRYNVTSVYGEIRLCRVPGTDSGQECLPFGDTQRVASGEGTVSVAGSVEVPDDTPEVMVIVRLKVPLGDDERVVHRVRLSWTQRLT